MEQGIVQLFLPSVLEVSLFFSFPPMAETQRLHDRLAGTIWTRTLMGDRNETAGTWITRRISQSKTAPHLDPHLTLSC